MAVYSDVLICNMALSRIGVLTLIEDINEASAEAQACKIFFNPSRDFVLGSANWPFLTRYAGLGLVATDPNDDWKASYRLPSDCIYAMRLVLAPGRIYTPAPPFAISGDAQGNLLLCDLTEANLEYIAKVVHGCHSPGRSPGNRHGCAVLQQTDVVLAKDDDVRLLIVKDELLLSGDGVRLGRSDVGCAGAILHAAKLLDYAILACLERHAVPRLIRPTG